MKNKINKFRKLDTFSKVQLTLTTGVISLLMAVVINWGMNDFISYF